MVSKKALDRASKISTVTVWIFMFIYSLTILFLFAWIIINSFKTRVEFSLSPFAFPKKLSFENYGNALQKFFVPIATSGGTRNVYVEELLLNSLIYIIGCALMSTFTPCVVAYAVTKFKFSLNKVIDGIVIVTMILPIIGALPSEIQMSKALGLYDNFFGMFFMKMTFLGANYLFFKSAFRSVPNELSEAARIDGASRLRIMLKINLPMISNILLIIFIMQCIGFWADWQTPMIYLPSRPTLAFSLYENQFSNDPTISFKPVQLAACIMASIPTLAIFIVFRKKMMGGLAFGGLKG